MSFDVEKFDTTNFKDRTEKVPVPKLKKFFKLKKNEKPIWEIKGLNSHELAIVNNAVAANKGKELLLDVLSEGISKEKINAIRKAVNIIKLSDNVPDDIVRRHATIIIGSINPKCTEEMAVKLGINYPTILFLLSQKIYGLTEKGRVGE